MRCKVWGAGCAPHIHDAEHLALPRGELGLEPSFGFQYQVSGVGSCLHVASNARFRGSGIRFRVLFAPHIHRMERVSPSGEEKLASYQVLGCVYQFSSIMFRVSWLGFRVSKFGFRVSSFEYDVSGFVFFGSSGGYQNLGFGYQDPGIQIWVLGIKFRVPRSGFGYRVSDSGL